MIHLGSKAHALESKGIHTERGDYNRRIMDIRGAIDFIKRTSASIEAFKERAGTVINEVTDIIKSVAKRHGILQLSIVSGKYLRKVTHRERLQDAENMMRFVEKKGILRITESALKKVLELAYAEVLDYNNDNEERERRNEERALSRKLVRQKSKGYDFQEL
ncbi:hypothetical protein SAMN05216390_1264 [Lachnospiraceae bacterium KH1T2]|nr:hypothetical protein SAMN05216390_1264 [Lachnospiraceae bacterium KH1T2]